MIPRLSLVFVLFCNASLLAQLKEHTVGDTLFVWSDSGLLVRRQPDKNSEAITKLNYGEGVVVQGVNDSYTDLDIVPSVKTSKQEFPAINVTGRFLKIIVRGEVGYVYEGLLSRLKPINTKENLESYFKRVFGQPKVLADTHNGDYRLRRIAYPNGNILQEEGAMSFFENRYLVFDVTLREGYLLASRLLRFEQEYRKQISEGDWISTHPERCDASAIIFSDGELSTVDIRLEAHCVTIRYYGGN